MPHAEWTNCAVVTLPWRQLRDEVPHTGSLSASRGFSPFGVLVCFIPSLFSSFFLCPLFHSCLASTPRYPCSRASFSRSRTRRTDVSRFFFLLFLSNLSYFFSFWTTSTANLRRVFAVSLALFLLRFSQWSRYVSPSSFFPRSLLRQRSRAAATASPSAHGIPRSLSRSSVESATEQISNKWDGCAKPRRFNYWCLVAAHRESRVAALSSLRVAGTLPFFRLLLSSFLGKHSSLLTRWQCSLYLFFLNTVVMPTSPHLNTRRLSDARVFITRAVHYICPGKLTPRNAQRLARRQAKLSFSCARVYLCMQVYVYINTAII